MNRQYVNVNSGKVIFVTIPNASQNASNASPRRQYLINSGDPPSLYLIIIHHHIITSSNPHVRFGPCLPQRLGFFGELM